MPEDFHFLQPEWFYLLLPLAVLLFWMLRSEGGNNDPWRKLIDQDLMPWLRVNTAGIKRRMPVWLIAAGWVIAIIALANPVWEKLPQPVFQTDQAKVIVLDLSRSMNSADLKPSRIERARFKVSDILARQQEGAIGLVVFAGDAFVVSPLTRDADTIVAMLEALKPGIMPVQGSRADLGLLKAAELLQQAGRIKGEILLLADSYADERALKAARELRQQGVITSVLGIGTEQGAPLPTGRGEFMRNSKDEIITTRLDVQAMQDLASAGGGDYVSLSADDADIKRLLNERIVGSRQRADDEFSQTIQWKETGPWLAILLLPLAALAFRRGWLLSVALVVFVGMPFESARAFTLQDLWQRQDQQAYKALLEGDAERASTLAEDPLLKGAADYKRGDFDAALESFSVVPEGYEESSVAAYNRGNALAKLGRYEEAIDAYKKALAGQPDMDDASFNKEAIEKLLQQQQQQSQGGQQGQQGQQSQSGQQGQQGQQSQSGQQGQQENSNTEQGESGQQQNGGGKGQQQADSADGNGDKSAQSDENAFARAAEQAANEAGEENTQQPGGMTAQEDEAENQQNADDLQSQSAAESGSQPESESAAKAEAGQPRQQTSTDETGTTRVMADDLTSEEQLAAEQWLRRIPDDPAGLLRRKLRYQYIQRGGSAGNPSDPQPW